ncbi:MAG: hypothetical protein OXH57_09940 [Ekhidna sp.]|nr:hypothetical protein [Ekhidna sp.]
MTLPSRRATPLLLLFLYVSSSNDATDKPDEVVMLTFTDDPDNARPSGVAEINVSTTVTIRDDDPTVVTLARTGSSTVDEGETVEFTVTLGRALISTPMKSLMCR